MSRNFGTRGEVFALRPTVPDALSGLGYIPRDAALVSGDFFLRDSGGRCVATSGSGGYRVLANDPALTGVSRGVYPGPLSFGKE